LNTKALKEAEKQFLKKYPGGFYNIEMVELGKKHKMEKLEMVAKESFNKKNFNDADFIISEMSKLVSRSTMISMFEKPKFKSMVTGLSKKEKGIFAESIFELLHGKEKMGFELLISELQKRKMAKWTLATVVQTYYRPQKEVLIKPSTTKLIIEKLNLELVYRPTPTWDFYSKYRKTIKDLKTKVNENLAPNNPAFCGFLMMSLGEML